MKVYTPSYYTHFHCKKGDCKNTCCANWAVEVDENSLKKYDKLDTPLGVRIKNELAGGGGECHFKLTSEGRCPFLCAEGLCEIMLELGEENAPEICRLHPRFKNVLSDRVELCLGASCEEAARIITDYKDKPTLILTKGESECLTDFEKELIEKRDLMSSFVYTFRGTGEELLDALFPSLVPHRAATFAAAYEVLGGLAYIDGGFRDSVLALAGRSTPLNNMLTDEQRAIAAYLILRHITPAVDDEELLLRSHLTLFALRLIFSLLEENRYTPCEALRLFSQEIEYCPDNMEELFSAIEFELAFL